MSSLLDTAVSLLLEGDPSSIHAQGLLFGGSLLEGHGRVQKNELISFLLKHVSEDNEIPKYFVRFSDQVTTHNTQNDKRPPRSKEELDADAETRYTVDNKTNTDRKNPKKPPAFISKPPKQSDIPKLGMRILQHTQFNTPQAVYGYGLTRSFFHEYLDPKTIKNTFADRHPFINVFSVRSPHASKVLNINKYNNEDLKNDLAKLKDLFPAQMEDSDISELVAVVEKLFDLVTELYDGVINTKLSNDDLYKLSLNIFKMGGEDDGELAYAYQNLSVKVNDQFALKLIDLLEPITNLIHKYISAPEDKKYNSKKSTRVNLSKLQLALRDAISALQSASEKSSIVQDALASARVQSAGGKIWNVTRVLSIEAHNKSTNRGSASSIVRWAEILKKLGYDWAYDSGAGIIHPNEDQQAAFFRGDIFDVAWQGPNPKLQDFPDLDDPDFQAQIERNKEASRASKLLMSAVDKSGYTLKQLESTTSTSVRLSIFNKWVADLFKDSFSVYKLTGLSSEVQNYFWKILISFTGASENTFKHWRALNKLYDIGRGVSSYFDDIAMAPNHTVKCVYLLKRIYEWIGEYKHLPMPLFATKVDIESFKHALKDTKLAAISDFLQELSVMTQEMMDFQFVLSTKGFISLYNKDPKLAGTALTPAKLYYDHDKCVNVATDTAPFKEQSGSFIALLYSMPSLP